MDLDEELTRNAPGWLIDDLSQWANQEHLAQAALAKLEAVKAAKLLGQDRKAMNGLGAPKLEIPSYAFHAWGQRLGYSCWQDKQFLKEFWRDNPECRVQSVGTKPIYVGYGSKSDGAKKQFSKSYG